MATFRSRDVEYRHGSTRMIGRLVLPPHRDGPRPAVVVVHDAFGRGPAMVEVAERLAAQGMVGFAADVWGDAATPSDDAEIGPRIGAMVTRRVEWRGRVSAAFEALAAQPEVDADRLAGVGFCFGGSSLLEHVRAGGSAVAIASIHGGLDLVERGWEAADSATRVLVCTGSADPFATPEQWRALRDDMTGAGVPWELDLYAGAKHAFTNPWADQAGRPDMFAHDPWAAARSWASAERFLADALA